MFLFVLRRRTAMSLKKLLLTNDVTPPLVDICSESAFVSTPFSSMDIDDIDDVVAV